MTISSRVHSELFASEIPAKTASHQDSQAKLIKMPLNNPRVDPNSKAFVKNQRRRERRRRGAHPSSQRLEPKGLAWTAEEHDRFLRGLELYPRGPWKEVARFVGTRTVRQTMTHAQKYRQKIARHQRGLHPGSPSKPQADTPPTSPRRAGAIARRASHKVSTVNVAATSSAVCEAYDEETPVAVPNSANGLEMLPATTAFALPSDHLSSLDCQAAGFRTWEQNASFGGSSISFQLSLLRNEQSIHLGPSTVSSAESDLTLNDDILDDLMDEGLLQHVIDQYLDTDTFSCAPVPSHYDFEERYLLGAERC